MLAIILASAIATSPAPKLVVSPIAGLMATELHDTFQEKRGRTSHEAVDIMAPRGTPVHAVAAGTIAKLFLSKPGGNTIYEFDDAAEFCFYYAHLDRYAANVHEGMRVAAGDVIGYVGSTGNANPANPHLHFTIFQLGPEKHWWQGTPINPYPLLMRLVGSRS